MATNFSQTITETVSRVPRPVRILIVVAVVLLVVAIALPVVLMTQPAIMGRIAEYSDNQESLTTSLHAGLSCGQCHEAAQLKAGNVLPLTVDFYRTVFSPDTEPAFIEMESPRRDACFDCHEHDWAHDSERVTRVPHPAHLAVTTETRECAECHKWTAHLEDNIEAHQRQQFSGVCAAYECHAGWKSMDECADCHHILLDDPAQWASVHPQTVFNTGVGGCLELCHDVKQCQTCHTTGESPFSGELAQTERGRIEELHGRPDWEAQHGVSALADQSVCVSCHISTGQCLDCHSRRPASHGPTETWISQHKNFVKSDDQCVTCHERTWCDACHDQFKGSR